MNVGVCFYYCLHMLLKLEQEVTSKERKLKMLEADLDKAEDENIDLKEKCKNLESENEDLNRRIKQQEHQIDTLESEQHFL